MRATIREHLRAALLWLLDHLKPLKPSEQALISYGAELERQRQLPKGFIPAVYEPPEKITDPTQEVHRLVETGRITALIHTQRLPTVKGLHKILLRSEPPADDKWLLDVEPAKPESEPESALDQLSQLVETQHKLEAVRQRHEGRGKAS